MLDRTTMKHQFSHEHFHNGCENFATLPSNLARVAKISQPSCLPIFATLPQFRKGCKNFATLFLTPYNLCQPLRHFCFWHP